MLSEADIEAIAQRVVELLHEQPMGSPRLLTAQQLADLLGVERGWIYEHAEELGAVRIGDGQRPRLRFDPDRALAARQHRAPHVEPEPERTTARRRTTSRTAELLPIRGEKAA